MTRHLHALILWATLCGALAATAAEPDTPEQSAAAPISATMTARDAGSAQWFFAMAPDDVLTLLAVNTRLDMLDYYNSGVQRPSRDAAGGRAIVTSSTGSRITFECGDSCAYELAVFRAGTDTVVALVETLHYPMADSRIEWYSSRWEPLRPLLAEPQLADWLTGDGRKHADEVRAALPFITASATTDPDSGMLTLTRTIDGFFTDADKPKALQWVRPSISYTIKGTRFVKK